MVKPNPKKTPFIEEPFKFNDLAFDYIWERLKLNIDYAYPEIEAHLLESFNLRAGNGVQILKKPIKLQLECPKCAKIWNSENGVAKMFF